MSTDDVDLQVIKLIKPILQDETETLATVRKQSHDTAEFVAKYKTEQCRYWTATGECPFNEAVHSPIIKCAFAHGRVEMRDKLHCNRNYKTKLCNNFSQTGVCKYGERCQFRHETHKKPMKPRSTTFSQLLDHLTELPPSSAFPKRLRLFSEMDVDPIGNIDWGYKKSRTYTM